MDYAGIADAHKRPRMMTGKGWRTLIQEHLFPAIIKCLLRILVFVSLGERRKRGDVLLYITETSQSQPLRNPKFEYPTSASRIRISDLRLPFLIEPGRESQQRDKVIHPLSRRRMVTSHSPCDVYVPRWN
jgi:hypothetical protein